MNRDVIEGSQGNPVATAAYKYYHECIKRAKSSTNRGILFDLHGQVCLSRSIDDAIQLYKSFLDLLINFYFLDLINIFQLIEPR